MIKYILETLHVDNKASCAVKIYKNNPLKNFKLGVHTQCASPGPAFGNNSFWYYFNTINILILDKNFAWTYLMLLSALKIYIYCILTLPVFGSCNVSSLLLYIHSGPGPPHGLLEGSSHLGLLGYHPGDVDHTEGVETVQRANAPRESTLHVVTQQPIRTLLLWYLAKRTCLMGRRTDNSIL